MEQKGIIINNGPMLNAYPDSIGDRLSEMVHMLESLEFTNAFASFYILPSIFNTDLDRGFSVISYDVNKEYATQNDLNKLKEKQIDLKLDFILNHLSVLSEQFQDIIENGENSKYKDFFIDWNKFWKNNGTMTKEGYIEPNTELIKNMFYRKPGLPILMVRMPDGKDIPYWNTFYQEIRYRKLDVQDLVKQLKMQYVTAEKIVMLVNEELENGKKPSEIFFGAYEVYQDEVIALLEKTRCYLGQMDLNIKSPLVWEYYADTLEKLSAYGAKIVRLDAFAYAPKEVGEKNFMNDPGTWELLEKVQKLASLKGVTLLPEIHSSYSEKTYEILTKKGYMTYDFFLPGLIIDALEGGGTTRLANWAREQYDKKIRTVNMLGCHDGIPMLDLKGIMPDERIEELIQVVLKRGGMVKNLHGAKNIYYQVNATYYSALGEDDKKMLLARALQLFMPGKPQIWYLDLFCGKNDYEAVERAGAAGHKEINRTNLSIDDISLAIDNQAVKKQLELLKFRNTSPAFGWDSDFSVMEEGSEIKFTWKQNGYEAILVANIETYDFSVVKIYMDKEKVVMKQGL